MAKANRLPLHAVVIRIVVCLALLVAASAVVRHFVATKPQPPRHAVETAHPVVAVVPIGLESIAPQWSGYGTVEAISSADVPARLAATVVAIADGIDEGATVRAGELLVGLDPIDFIEQAQVSARVLEDLAAQLERLEVENESWTRRAELAAEQVRLAEAEFQRVATAVERGAAKERELDLSRQSLVGAIRDETAVREEVAKIGPRRAGLLAQKAAEEARNRLARENVQRTEIRAPIDGTLETVDVEVGESTTPGQRVVRIVDRARVEVRLRLPAEARGWVRLGDPVELRTTGRRPRRWTATVARIAPSDDPRTRTATVYVELAQAPDDPAALAPGAFVRGIVSSRLAERRSVVPRRAIRNDRVYVVDDGGMVHGHSATIAYQVEGARPESGLPDRLWVVLEETLPADGRLVVEPSARILDGVLVRPTSPAGVPEMGASR